MQETLEPGERTVFISLKDEERKYLSGHVIDGRNLFPGVGYLVSCKMQYVPNVICFYFC
jgi:fatty acid synthase